MISREPLYLLTIFLLLILLSEWLGKQKYLKHVGSVLLVILLAAVFANLGIIPSSTDAPPLYDGIFHYAAPLGIFFLMLQVSLKDLRFAGLPMILMFLVGSAATMAGVLLGYKLLAPQQNGIPLSYAVAGMYTGTYIGGSANLNAIAVEYGVTKDGTLFAAINAADNIITAIWMMLTLLLPSLAQRYFPRKRTSLPRSVQDKEAMEKNRTAAPAFQLRDLVLLLALGLGTLFLSEEGARHVKGLPSILILTTLALLLAQLPFIQKLQGARILGSGLILLFLAVVGAYCDLHALTSSGQQAGLLLLWVTLIVFTHGFLIFFIGGLFKQDWALVSIASNANIGGATSAPVCASSIGRPDLQFPGLLAGSVGNAIGTYLGVFIAELLR